MFKGCNRLKLEINNKKKRVKFLEANNAVLKQSYGSKRKPQGNFKTQ